MLSDFMQILNSTRKYYTNNEYFTKHTLFSIIYLLQKEILNHRNKHEKNCASY
jgi:hypothetical protein